MKHYEKLALDYLETIRGERINAYTDCQKIFAQGYKAAIAELRSTTAKQEFEDAEVGGLPNWWWADYLDRDVEDSEIKSNES